jgi:prepilin-type N-terminal cleavage/methylation domain-containing protein
MRDARGFSLIEMLIAMTITLLALLAALAGYQQFNALRAYAHGNVKIQNNLRLGIDRLERDLRMSGFGVPAGAQISGTALWTPALFFANATSLGFRADVDGGAASIVCTPKSTNTNCPLSKLRLDSIAYYQRLNCAALSGTGNLKLIAVNPTGAWQPVACSSFSTADNSITISPNATNDSFTAGQSRAYTMEQVYYRYVAASQPPYGRLERAVVYDNAPSDTFPPTGATWTVVASQLTDFWLEYQNDAGGTVSGSPLTSAQRASVRRIVMFLEGYDEAGPDAAPQVIQLRSQVALRNG